MSLAEFPEHVLAGARGFEAKEVSPETLRKWFVVLSGWLFRLAEMKTEAQSSWLVSQVALKKVKFMQFTKARAEGQSVSAAEKSAELNQAYLDAYLEEVTAEARYRSLDARYDSLKEAIQSLKKATDTSVQEARLLGGPNP